MFVRTQEDVDGHTYDSVGEHPVFRLHRRTHTPMSQKSKKATQR